METLLEEEEFLASPGRSPSASETLLEQPSPERLDSLSESVTSCDSSHWLHSRRYYEAHDGCHVMEWESFRSCSSFASSANGDSPTMGSHGLQVSDLPMGPEELGELRNELKRKMSLERSKHLVSTWTREKFKLWLLKSEQLLVARGLIPGIGTWGRQWRFKLKQQHILDLQREAVDLAEAITRMPLPPPARPISPPKKLVGQQTTLALIRKFLVNRDDDDNVHIVGVYGPEGVGKTRILEELHDHLAKEDESARFDVIIWLTISEGSSSVRRIQELIADQLGSSFEDESEEKEVEGNHRAAILRNTLSSMRFLLVLDGIHGVLDLEDVGIPQPDTSSRWKIVITSRSKEVCENMGVGIPGLLQVSPLTGNESWELFCDIVGGADDEESWIKDHDMNFIAWWLVHIFYRRTHKLKEIAEGLSKQKRTSFSWSVYGRQKLRFNPHALIPAGKGAYYLKDEINVFGIGPS